MPAPGLGDEIDALGGAAGEDDFLVVGGVDERGHFPAGIFVQMVAVWLS
jgi:hypothetical protein